MPFTGRTRFFSVGIDGGGNVEPAPAHSDADLVVTRMLAAPARLEVTDFDVQKGTTQRSYIRYVDLTFNLGAEHLDPLVESLADDIQSNDRIRLTRSELDGTNGQIVSLDGLLKAVDHAIEFDFGINGLGGNRNSTLGDGYYRIELDLDGDGTFETTRSFYRLLGDVNGDRIVSMVDIALISGSLGRSETLLDEDINGDGVVNHFDRILAGRSLNRTLADWLHLDD